MYNISEPYTKEEIVRELKKVYQESTNYWNSFSTQTFLASIGEAWSPADNIRHLIKSTRPLVKALMLPRVALLVLFGRARMPSRSYREIKDTYLGILATGATAGRFAPSRQNQPADPEAWRTALMVERDRVAAELEKVIMRWNENALDRYRLPHPLLGKLTVREMLFFTLYHNLHHLQNVARRISDSK